MTYKNPGVAKNGVKGKAPRLTIEFKNWAGLIEFYNRVMEVTDDFDGSALREADGLDARQTVDILVRSEQEVAEHPGAIYPLSEKADGETLDTYRGRLSIVQREVLDAVLEGAI